jgi:hypothetical protein
MYRSMFIVVAALVAVLAVACVPPPAAVPGSGETPAAVPAGGEQPDFANQALDWLATETGVSAADLRLVEAERVEWTDSCFGLGGPAESCLAAVTPGWRIVFEAGGQQYEVRTDTAGESFRLAPQGS